jgi:transcriptional regulator with XRE-family HTH domain
VADTSPISARDDRYTVRTNLPIAIRSLRARNRWRQRDLAARAGLSRDAVSRVERGHLEGLTLGTIGRLVSALDASLVVEIRWQGADLDRLADARHAQLQELTARRLASAGWMPRVEVSFNHYGDRGSCDVVAWHPSTQTLLVVEVKSRLGNVQDTLHRLDVKARLGPVIANQLNWPNPASVARALVLADERTSRRVLARHEALFASFGTRGWAASRWLRRPGPGRASLLWFQSLADSDGARVTGPFRVRSETRAG